MNKQKTFGQVFTPSWIVNEILNLVGYFDEGILDKYVLEPASGDGVFLAEIVERYINVSMTNDIKPNAIKLNLEKYIYGVEIDFSEYQKSIQLLDNLINTKFGSEITVQWNIHNKDTFDFYKDFPNFFDYIVGNPPYVRIHNISNETRNILSKNFKFASGTIDLYLPFLEMSLAMMNESARLGFITPNSLLHNSSYKAFRSYLKRLKNLEILIDFKANKIFKGFSTYTSITILNNNRKEDFFTYKELIGSKILEVNKVEYKLLNDNDWSFSNEADQKFILGLSTGKNSRVKDFFDVQYGFATLRDKIFIANAELYNDSLVTFNNHLVEKNILKKIVKGSRFKGTIDENNLILFPYFKSGDKYIPFQEDNLATNYPNAYKYLLANKDELESRDLDKGAMWYEFGRSQGVQSMHKEKIVLSPLINGKVTFYRIPADVLVYSGIFIVKNKSYSNWALIEQVLRSEDFFRYIRITGKDFSGGYKSITTKQIKEFLICASNPQSIF